MSLGEDVILEFALPYVVTRSPAPALLNGRAVPGATAEVTIRACVQPSNGRDLLLLEEGMRTREAVTIYTPDFIRTATDDGAPPDVLPYGGETWQVQTVKDWSGAGGYYKGIAIKVPR